MSSPFFGIWELMMITLYSIPESLYSAKLRIVLRMKGVPFEVVAPPGGYGSEVYKQVVPAGTVPAIVHDGFVLADSEAIAEYLNEVFPEPQMLPGDARARARARERSRFHDTRLEPEVRAMFGQIAPGRDASLVDAKGALLNGRLAQLAGLVAGHDALTLGDVGFPISFLWMDLFAPVLGWDLDWPGEVQAYRQALEANPFVAEELASYRPHAEAWVAMKTSG